jgi:hypothetical protein
MNAWLDRTQRFAGLLLALQGFGHILLGAPTYYGALSQDLVWFIGSGLAMISIGLLNVAAGTHPLRWPRYLIVAVNMSWLLLMSALVATSQSWRTILVASLSFACLVGSVGSLTSAPGKD